MNPLIVVISVLAQLASGVPWADEQVAWAAEKYLLSPEQILQIDLKTQEKLGITKGIVVLTFDDGFASHYNIVYKKLLEHGLCGTFFLVTQKMDAPAVLDHFYDTMKWVEAKEMMQVKEWKDAQGVVHQIRPGCFEMAPHTQHHDTSLADLFKNHPFVGHQELVGSVEDMADWLGLEPPFDFAPPFGNDKDSTDPKTGKYEREVYETLKTITDDTDTLLFNASVGMQGDPIGEGIGLNSLSRADRYNLARQVIDHNTKARQVCRYVQHAGADDPKGWSRVKRPYLYFLGWHNFVKEGDPALNDPKKREWVSSEETFDQILKCIDDEVGKGNIEVLNMKEAVEKITPKPVPPIKPSAPGSTEPVAAKAAAKTP
jgi:peptidoglycan/xylan/chitin deacetylase (PgdA/CDA1 family)